jgi:Zn-dependent protease with chaperone function
MGSRDFTTMAIVTFCSLTGFTAGMTMLANLIPQTLKSIELTPKFFSTSGTIFTAQLVTAQSSWHYIILAIPWLIIGLVIFRLALGFHFLRARTRGFSKVDPILQSRFDAIADRIGIKPVAVYVGSCMPVAFSDQSGVYLGKPIISSLPDEDVDAIIAHEFSHIRRKDVPARWLWLLTESLAFGFFSKKLSKTYLLDVEKKADREAVKVMGSPYPLAQALVSVARLSNSFAVNFGGEDVTQRALALLEEEQKQTAKPFPKIALAFCLTLLAAVVFWPQPVIPSIPGVSEADAHRLLEGKALAIMQKSGSQSNTVKIKLYPTEAIKQLPDGRIILDRRQTIGTL